MEVKRIGSQVEYERKIRIAMKELHYIPEVDGLSFDDLCIHPNLYLPEGFKGPKFDIFGETWNPLGHIRA